MQASIDQPELILRHMHAPARGWAVHANNVCETRD